MIKTVAYKLGFLAILFVGLNLIYIYTLFEQDIKKNAPCAYQCMNLPKGTDVIYFGESSNFTVDGDDSTQLYISELVNYYAPELKMVTIDTPAVHAGIYRYWISSLTYYKPKAILVTMNLRSFDAAWIHSKLETPLLKSVRLLKPTPKLLNRFLLSVNNFEDISEAERDSTLQDVWRNEVLEFPYPFKYKTVREWDNGMGNGGWLNADGSWDMKRINFAAHFIKGYAFNIKETNPRIKDFDAIAKWGIDNQVKVYFNIMGENVAMADSLVGKDLVFLMRQNRDYLVSRYTKMGAVVIDNLESVGINDFLDKDWTTEHYNYKGRIAIAKKVALNLNIN